MSPAAPVLAAASAAPAPDHAPALDHAQLSSMDAVSDDEMGRDLLFGMAVGTPLTYLLIVGVCLAGGVRLADAAIVGILPCFLSGVFFGGILPLSRQMARHETLERAAMHRASVVPLPPAPAVAPAA